MESKHHINLIDALVKQIIQGERDQAKSFLQNINLKNVDYLGKTSLHWACERYASKEVIELFLNQCPEAALIQDRYGFLPIHYSIRFEEKEVTKLLLEVAPESITKFDNRGETPLFSCMQAKGFLENIQAMLETCPTALKQVNYHGETAIDYFFTLWYGFVREIVNDYCICEDRIQKIEMSRLIGHRWTCQDIFDASSLLLYHYNKLSTNKRIRDLSLLESSIMNPSCPWIFSELLIRLSPHQVESLSRNILFPFTANVKKPVYDMIFVCSKCGSQFETGIVHRDYCSCNECTKGSSFFKNYIQTIRDEELEKLQLIFVCLQMNPALCAI